MHCVVSELQWFLAHTFQNVVYVGQMIPATSLNEARKKAVNPPEGFLYTYYCDQHTYARQVGINNPVSTHHLDYCYSYCCKY